MEFDLLSLISFAHNILMYIKDLARSILDFLLTDIEFLGQSVDLIYILFGGGLIVFLGIKIGAELIT